MQFRKTPGKWFESLLHCLYHANPTGVFRPRIAPISAFPFAGYTLPKEKKERRHLGTFGDIWGHMSHFHATTRRFRPHKAKPPDIRNLMFTSMQIVGPADARTGTDLGD